MSARQALWMFVGLAAWSACATNASGQPRESTRVFDCIIEPSLRLKISTPVAGVLRDVMVDRGDVIRKGDTLAVLESAVEEANVALSEARAQNDSTVKGRQSRLEFLERKRSRISQLQSRGSATDVALDEAETDTRVARNELQEAESALRLAVLEHNRAVELLRLRSIKSPIDGLVVERTLGPGEYAYEQAPIMTIAQVDPLNVEVYVPVALYSAVQVGGRAVVTPAEPIGGTHKATIAIIDSIFDARSSTFGIRLKLPNPERKIPGGLRCRIQFESN